MPLVYKLYTILTSSAVLSSVLVINKATSIFLVQHSLFSNGLGWNYSRLHIRWCVTHPSSFPFLYPQSSFPLISKGVHFQSYIACYVLIQPIIVTVIPNLHILVQTYKYFHPMYIYPTHADLHSQSCMFTQNVPVKLMLMVNGLTELLLQLQLPFYLFKSHLSLTYLISGTWVFLSR